MTALVRDPGGTPSPLRRETAAMHLGAHEIRGGRGTPAGAAVFRGHKSFQEGRRNKIMQHSRDESDRSSGMGGGSAGQQQGGQGSWSSQPGQQSGQSGMSPSGTHQS